MGSNQLVIIHNVFLFFHFSMVVLTESDCMKKKTFKERCWNSVKIVLTFLKNSTTMIFILARYLMDTGYSMSSPTTEDASIT